MFNRNWNVTKFKIIGILIFAAAFAAGSAFAAPIKIMPLGASMIEKHVTLNRGLPGPDHKHALTMPEFAAMCAEVRLAEQALGDGVKRVMPSEVPLYKYRSGLIVKRRPTLMFNGYGEQVASLYAGMDLKANY